MQYDSDAIVQLCGTQAAGQSLNGAFNYAVALLNSSAREIRIRPRAVRLISNGDEQRMLEPVCKVVEG